MYDSLYNCKYKCVCVYIFKLPFEKIPLRWIFLRISAICSVGLIYAVATFSPIQTLLTDWQVHFSNKELWICSLKPHHQFPVQSLHQLHNLWLLPTMFILCLFFFFTRHVKGLFVLRNISKHLVYTCGYSHILPMC